LHYFCNLFLNFLLFLLLPLPITFFWLDPCFCFLSHCALYAKEKQIAQIVSIKKACRKQIFTRHRHARIYKNLFSYLLHRK
jgi:hypothetical protein